MLINETKRKLLNGETVYGVISSSNDAIIPEILGICGFDYYMLDGEHGLIDPAQVVHNVRACELNGITPLMRVGQREAKVLLPYLDSGVQGIMMPGLESADAVVAMVEAMKYPPLGLRGLGPARAGQHLLGSGPSQIDYVQAANKEILIMPQFEHIALLEKLPALAAVPGVDGIVIGPRDLALSMGHADGAHYDEVQSAIDEAIAIIRAAGRFAGITAGDAAGARRQAERGAQLILTSLPTLLQQSSIAFLAARDI